MKHKRPALLELFNAIQTTDGAAPLSQGDLDARLARRHMLSRLFDPSGPPEAAPEDSIPAAPMDDQMANTEYMRAPSPGVSHLYAPSGQPTAAPQAMADQSQPAPYHGPASGTPADLAALRRKQLAARGMSEGEILTQLVNDGIVDPRLLQMASRMPGRR